MLKARDIMTTDVITLTADTEITTATSLLLDKGINGVPVLDDQGLLVGILCQSDLMAQQKRLSLPSVFSFLDGFIPLKSMKRIEREIEKLSATTVGQAMTPNPETVTPNATLEDVATLMIDKRYHTVPVVDGGKLVGIIGKLDILKTIVD